ncbi:hypothetical protein ECC02_006689 [Trypanosoma cruzi]|uniref:Trans-sialidase n=1 Tax=Trypanosoma cruzi TaxID=5693 RepID=A0A7J6Y1A9_TRYCR|nr:hypothetical protein ECC02_006689 [Trypanosoma cruzi]
MTLGALLRTAQRSLAGERETAGYSPVVSEQFWWPHFHPSMPLPSSTSIGGKFRCRSRGTKFPRIRRHQLGPAYMEWGRFRSLFRPPGRIQLLETGGGPGSTSLRVLIAWIDAVEAERDPADRFMNFGRILVQAFRVQLMTASDPGIPLSNVRTRLCAAVHEADAFSRATQPPAERRGTQRPVRCQSCRVCGHDTSKSNVRDATRGSYSQRGRPSINGRGAACCFLLERTTAAPSIPPPPTIPHIRRTAPPALHPILQIARRNHREGQWSLSAKDARLWYDETPTSPLWASYMRRANEVAREMWAPSTWEQIMSLAGRFTTFCCTHEQPMNEESCAAFLLAIELAPSTRRQYARMLRSMLEMNRTPLGMTILGLRNIAARSETKQARPLTEEEMNQVIRSRTDWKERVVLRLAWITASLLFEIAALTPNNVTLEADGTIILDWSVAPKTARSDPHRALRSVRIRGQDALDSIKLRRTLQENEKLTNIATAQVERALVPWNATAHSTKRVR